MNADESPSLTEPVEGAAAAACGLLTPAEAKGLIGGDYPPTPGMVAGLPNCQWNTPAGAFLQVVSMPGSQWAQGLPNAVQVLQDSGSVPPGTRYADRLEVAAASVAAGGTLGNTRACHVFSDMAEMTGRPPGWQELVTVFPSNEDAQVVVASMCSSGRFTSVSLNDLAGLAEPVPARELLLALRTAHRRALG